MARRILWSGSVTLPAPTSITVNDEIIWTSDTGRTLAGYMVGDPVAEKKTAYGRDMELEGTFVVTNHGVYEILR